MATRLPISNTSPEMLPPKNNVIRSLTVLSGDEKMGEIHPALNDSGTTNNYDGWTCKPYFSDDLISSSYTDDMHSDEVHKVSGSLSDNSDWDNYQMLYPTVSEELGEKLLAWEPRDDLQFDDELLMLSGKKKSLFRNGMTSGQHHLKLKSIKHSVFCSDSDSDLDDLYHILDQSELALKMADKSLTKMKNSMGTRLQYNSTKYDNIIMMYLTNVRCMEGILLHLKSENIPQQDVRKVHDLIHQWEKLYAIASEYHKQAKYLSDVADLLESMHIHIHEAEDCSTFDSNKSAEELREAIILLKEKKILLKQQSQQQNNFQRQLLDFLTLHPTICVDRYLLELSSLQKASSYVISKVSYNLNQHTEWLEYLDSQHTLDKLLTSDRKRLHTLLYQQEYNIQLTKKDVMKELEILKSNLSLHESKMFLLQSTCTRLAKDSDSSFQHLPLASLADLRNQLFMMSQRCCHIYQGTEDDERIPMDKQSDLGKLAMSATAVYKVFKNSKRYLYVEFL